MKRQVEKGAKTIYGRRKGVADRVLNFKKQEKV